MEESDLLKKRVQAFTEKHRIQQLIRMKKVELDQEKFKLQHLKKKALREQWLLQDSSSHTFPNQQSLQSDQQQTRALQLHIHSIEMDIYSLEREESRISTNENLILNRLKAVEKSPEELIREVRVNFVPGRCLSTATEADATKALLTEHSTVRSAVEKSNENAGHKLYGECVYALNSQQGSHDRSFISDLSASELLHPQLNHHQNLSRMGHCFYKHNDEGQNMDVCVRKHRRQDDNFVFGNNTAEKESSQMQKWQEQPHHEHHYDDQENHCSRQQHRSNHTSLWRDHHYGNHQRERLPYGSRPSDRHSPSYHHQPQLGGYISVDKELCYCYSPSSQTKNNHSPPQYADDIPYSIPSNNLDITQSITAIFMGFQAAEDDSNRSQECLGSLKAELIIIEDSEENKEDDMKRKKSHAQLGTSGLSAQGGISKNVGFLEEAETQMAQGIRKLNKHKPCCALC